MPKAMPNLTLGADERVEPAGPTFKIFSGALKAFERDAGQGVVRKMLSCTASSTSKDLHGDNMTDECVMNMAPQAKNKNMTIFLNHSYKWPEDIAGKTTDARVVQRMVGDEKFFDLDLEIELNEANARAVESWTAIKEQGIKAGISIGAMIEDYAFKDEDAGFWGGLEIKAVDLLEASIVGIPANQRSWVVNGIAALGAPKVIINKALGRSVPTEKSESELEEETLEDVLGEDGTTLDASASAAPSEEIPDGAEGTSSDADEPAGETTAEAALSAATDAVVSLKSTDVDQSLLEIVLGFLEGATEEVAGLRKQLADVTAELDEARQEVLKAAEIVETIARTPLGRKAQFAAPVSTFRSRFSGMYDEGFLKLLEGDTTDE